MYHLVLGCGRVVRALRMQTVLGILGSHTQVTELDKMALQTLGFCILVLVAFVGKLFMFFKYVH